jgi:hypothetical protein
MCSKRFYCKYDIFYSSESLHVPCVCKLTLVTLLMRTTDSVLSECMAYALIGLPKMAKFQFQYKNYYYSTIIKPHNVQYNSVDHIYIYMYLVTVNAQSYDSKSLFIDKST